MARNPKSRAKGASAASRGRAKITHGLIIQKDPLDRIFAGRKTWEIRGSRTAMRGLIALIESGTGCVVGTAELVRTEGPISLAELRRNHRKAGFLATDLYYKPTFAWVLRNATRLASPTRYRHRRGVVIWVRLTPAVADKVSAQHRAPTRRRSVQRGRAA
jgi:hypothetical protein